MIFSYFADFLQYGGNVDLPFMSRYRTHRYMKMVMKYRHIDWNLIPYFVLSHHNILIFIFLTQNQLTNIYFTANTYLIYFIFLFWVLVIKLSIDAWMLLLNLESPKRIKQTILTHWPDTSWAEKEDKALSTWGVQPQVQPLTWELETVTACRNGSNGLISLSTYKRDTTPHDSGNDLTQFVLVNF